MRFKKFRKTLHFYKVNFGVSAPWSVIVDRSFLAHVIQTKGEALRLFPKVLNGEARACVLSCAHAELQRDAVVGELVASLPVLACAHSPPLTPHDCLHAYLSTLGQRSLPLPPHAERVAFACQDAALRRTVGSRHAGVPLLFLSNNVVLMLDAPSPASLAAVAAREQARAGVGSSERSAVQEAVASALAEAGAERAEKAAQVSSALSHLTRSHALKRKAKGPNPLSVKKKQKKPPPTAPAPEPSSAESTGRKRKRHRKRGKGKGKSQDAKGDEEEQSDSADDAEASDDARPRKKARVADDA